MEKDAVIMIRIDAETKSDFFNYCKSELKKTASSVLSDFIKTKAKIYTKKTAKQHKIYNNTSCQISDKKKVRVAELIAKNAGVSLDTMYKVKKINANAIDEIKQELRNPDGKISINAAYEISELPADEQKAIINKLNRKQIISIAKKIKEIRLSTNKEV